MTHRIAPALLAILLTAGATQAQIVVEKNKWDLRTAALLQEAAQQRSTRGTTAATTQRFIITASDAAAAADSIRLLGGKATVIDAQTLTAAFPIDSIGRLAALHSVLRINATQRLRPLTATARELSNVTNAHDGLGLETPFTGKGVVVGVIDQGFQYKHPAFLDHDGNSRIIALWNHSKETGQPTTTIPSGSDGITDADGHATHVTGIACGTRYDNNPYYGMAPEADIIMVPSSFDNDNLLAEAKWIKETAEAAGKPWVINMSFGAQGGPHDGSTAYDRAMDAMCGKGGIMVAAMGNEGNQKIHTSAEMTKGSTMTLLLDNDVDDYNYVVFYGNATDGKEHFEVTPFAYVASTKKTVELSALKWNSVGTLAGGIDDDNNKECYQAYISLPNLATQAKASSSSDVYFGLRIKALDDNASFHAWCETGYGSFITKNGIGTAGDTQYLVSEGGASIPSAIAVGAYNGAPSWISAYDGKTYSYSSYTTTGQISSYSSPGPSLGNAIKPLVSAPGSTICSAFNRYNSSSGASRIDTSDRTIVCAIDRSTGAPISDYSTATYSSNDFYGVKSGTSMATPVVTGIVALWLQANPELTPADISDIIRTTSVHDAFTGTSEWNATRGYGKIDAYNGLKAALEKGNTNGIAPAISTATPITIDKGSRAWRLLFNIAVPQATIRLTGTDGKNVITQQLSDRSQGDEAVLAFDGIAPGVYIVNITTPEATISRKVIIGPTPALP